MSVGFVTGDYCVSQLLFIFSEINSSFDCDQTAVGSGIVLDISKTFNKVPFCV